MQSVVRLLGVRAGTLEISSEAQAAFERDFRFEDDLALHFDFEHFDFVCFHFVRRHSRHHAEKQKFSVRSVSDLPDSTEHSESESAENSESDFRKFGCVRFSSFFDLRSDPDCDPDLYDLHLQFVQLDSLPCWPPASSLLLFPPFPSSALSSCVAPS